MSNKKIILIAALTAVAFFVMVSACMASLSDAPSRPVGSAPVSQVPPTYDGPLVASERPAPPPAQVEASTRAPSGLSDGEYHVGEDIEKGRYKTAGPGSSEILDACYVARLKNDSGELSAIISNDIVRGPKSVTVNPGEYLELSGGCTWDKVG